jgi:hypothetical protein
VNFSLQVDKCVHRLSLYVSQTAGSAEERAWVKRLSSSGLRPSRVEWHAERQAERQAEGQAERQAGFITAISAAPELYAFWESVEILKISGVKADAALIRVSQASRTWLCSCRDHSWGLHTIKDPKPAQGSTHGTTHTKGHVFWQACQFVSLPCRLVCCLCTPDTSMTVVMGMSL